MRTLVEDWPHAGSITDSQREELILLLTNLTRGARLHTTHGTPLSGYLRFDHLISKLLTSIEVKRRTGEPVSLGRREWIIERFLGNGAYGEVWVGRHRLHPALRAFKFFTQPAAQDWLEREGTALYQVHQRLSGCANVIAYEDVELDGKPYPYLVLEYVPGGSLEEWILTAAEERQPLKHDELITGIARGLARAHAHHIYHRDLKPANVLLTDELNPVPKIADFGLSSFGVEAASSESLNLSQAVVVGTQMYLPPEAADPLASRFAAQDDIFALGVIWYQVLVGEIARPPYDFAERLHQLGVDSRTVKILSRCLASPDRRFKDACDLLALLDDDAAPEEWQIPEGCFDVGPLAKEYLDGLRAG